MKVTAALEMVYSKMDMRFQNDLKGSLNFTLRKRLSIKL